MCSTSPTQAAGDSIGFLPSGAAASIRWEKDFLFSQIKMILCQTILFRFRTKLVFYDVIRATGVFKITLINILFDSTNLFALTGYLEESCVLLPALRRHKRFLQVDQPR